MWSNIDLYFEPRNYCLSKYNWPIGEPEMTSFESAFLCGLIRDKKPKKIVEIGVAGGGTTVIVLKCLELLGIADETKMFSVDISENFYRGHGEKSGYLANELLNEKTDFQHEFLLGRFLPEVLEHIGGHIDFVILDTRHSTPGELLDFLAIYPFLISDAYIVLHDIAFNHYGYVPLGFATQLLLSCVNGKKILSKDNNRTSEYPNIGAFITTPETKESLFDVLNALMVTWRYVPDMKEFSIYQNHFRLMYGDDFADLFESIYKLQSLSNQKLIWNSKFFQFYMSIKRTIGKFLMK